MNREAINLRALKDLRCVWHASAIASNGTLIYGRGASQEQAVNDTHDRLVEYEAFIALPSAEKLKVFISKDRLLDNDKEMCIRLLAELVLDKLT